MPITELVIDRQLWGTGSLLNTDGTMCCLGHAAVACGVLKDRLRTYNNKNKTSDRVGYPLNSWTEVNYWMRWNGANSACDEAATINDHPMLSLTEKEEQLIKLFADNGVNLSFTGNHRETLGSSYDV